MNSVSVVRDSERIIGRVVDNEFHPLTPVPQGAAFDNLLDACCTSVESVFKEKGKDHLHPDYRVFQGQHASILMTGRHRLGYSVGHDGVESWIRQGTLRSPEELNPVLNRLLGEKKQAVRMRRLAPDWQTDHYDFQVLGSKFGLPAPPTREELERQRREEEARRQEQHRRDDEAYADLRKQQLAKEQAYERSPEGIRARTVQTVVEKLLEHLPVPVFTPEMSEKERRVALIDADLRREERAAITPYVTRLVELSGWSADAMLKKWNEATSVKLELDDLLDGVEGREEVTRELFCFRQLYDQISEIGVMTPSEIPALDEGMERLTFASRAAVLEFARSGKWGEILEKNKTRLTMSPEHTYVLDAIPLDHQWEEEHKS